MDDYLIRLSQNQVASKAIKALKLPIPLPKDLQRTGSSWNPTPLAGMTIVHGQSGCETEMTATCDHLRRSGAIVKNPRQARRQLVDGLFFDLSRANSIEALNDLYGFFHANLLKLKESGRIVLAVQGGALDPISTTMTQAASGFIKSLAKEVGAFGSTANVIVSNEATAGRSAAILQFLFSKYSSYISGQTFRVSNDVSGLSVNMNHQPLAGKLALVTGAARGIGYETSKTLAREGAHVVCLDLEGLEDPLLRLCNYISGTPLPCNIGSSSAYQAILDAVPPNFEGYDIVVHNAGINRDRTLAHMPKDFWHDTFDTNLSSVISITDRLREQGINDESNLVFVTSVSGIGGNYGQTNYSLTKAGLIGYTQALGAELSQRGIITNAVAPGFINTNMTHAMPVPIREWSKRFNALTQAGMPSDVAEVILFFCTRSAIGFSGQTHRVCGLNFTGA